MRDQLEAAGIRVTLDDRSEKVNLKIRDAQLQKVPYMLVVGGREAENGNRFRAQSQARRSGRETARRVYHGNSQLIDSKVFFGIGRMAWLLLAVVAGSLVYCVLVIVAARRYLAVRPSASGESSAA